jgi:hypothetical protein
VDHEEFWSRHDFATREEADAPLADWSRRYHHERFSLALHARTPVEKLPAKQAAHHASVAVREHAPFTSKSALAANGESSCSSRGHLDCLLQHRWVLRLPAFAESAVNQIIAKRMIKPNRCRWNRDTMQRRSPCAWPS